MPIHNLSTPPCLELSQRRPKRYSIRLRQQRFRAMTSETSGEADSSDQVKVRIFRAPCAGRERVPGKGTISRSERRKAPRAITAALPNEAVSGTALLPSKETGVQRQAGSDFLPNLSQGIHSAIGPAA